MNKILRFKACADVDPKKLKSPEYATDGSVVLIFLQSSMGQLVLQNKLIFLEQA